MNPRNLLPGILMAICLFAAGAVVVRHQRIANLRADQQRLLDATAAPEPQTIAATDTPASSSSGGTRSELLHLRNQVGQLTEFKRSLMSVNVENERLRTQLSIRGTNTSSGGLPPGYIRKAQAQWVGMSTPENTIQSFLWAIENRDLTNLVQLLTPKSAETMLREASKAGDKFFEEARALPGMRITSQEQMPDGSVQLHTEIVPGQPLGDTIRLRQIGGEWKLDFGPP